MHSAPAVSYPVGRSRLEGALVGLVAASSALVVWVWLGQSQNVGFRHVAGLFLWLVSTSLAVRHWVRAPLGSLAWNGKNWTWTCGSISKSVAPEVIIDLQQFFLLQINPTTGASFWICPERQNAAPQWLALRRAICCHEQTLSALDAGQESAENPPIEERS